MYWAYRRAMLVAMTTSECVGTRTQETEHVVLCSDSDSDGVSAGRFRGWLHSLRRLRSGRSRVRTDRPRRHARRADFVERAAMAREMHRL